MKNENLSLMEPSILQTFWISVTYLIVTLISPEKNLL